MSDAKKTPPPAPGEHPDDAAKLWRYEVALVQAEADELKAIGAEAASPFPDCEPWHFEFEFMVESYMQNFGMDAEGAAMLAARDVRKWAEGKPTGPVEEWTAEDRRRFEEPVGTCSTMSKEEGIALAIEAAGGLNVIYSPKRDEIAAEHARDRVAKDVAAGWATRRRARGARTITPTTTPVLARRRDQHRAAAQAHRGPPEDDPDPSHSSSFDLTASPSAHPGLTLSLGALTRGPFVVVHRSNVHRPTVPPSPALDHAEGVTAWAWAPTTHKEHHMTRRTAGESPQRFAARLLASKTKAAFTVSTKRQFVATNSSTRRGVAWARR